MYDPRIENQAEDWFHHEMHKRTAAEIIPQLEVPVGRSPYRLDYLIKSKKLKVGFEIDGKKYHDIESDSQRDLKILTEYPYISAIVRFEAHDIYWNAPLATLFICNHFPELIFSSIPLSSTARTPGEIKELERTQGGEYNCVSKSKENAWSYLKIRGVHDVKFMGMNKEYGYREYIYSIYFMGERQIKYLDDLEENIHEETPIEINPIDYCNIKTSKIRVMSL